VRDVIDVIQREEQIKEREIIEDLEKLTDRIE
jgi:hypothetical protein